MIDRGLVLEIVREALDAARIGVLVLDGADVGPQNALAEAVLGAGARSEEEARPVTGVLAHAAGITEEEARVWLAAARRGGAPLRYATDGGARPSARIEIELRAPLLERLPDVDALLVRRVERPIHDARLAHDLANLMQRVVAGISLFALRGDVDSADLADDLTDLADLSTRAAALARRLSSHPTVLPGAPGRLMRETARALLGPRLRWEVPEPLPRLAMTPEEWESLVLNLLFNAKDACGPEDPITVHVEVAEGALRLQVTDEGSGMDDEAQRRATEPGFSTKRLGTGMGLAHVARILGRCGGSLQIDSAPGAGTTMTVELPLGR